MHARCQKICLPGILPKEDREMELQQRGVNRERKCGIEETGTPQGREAEESPEC